MAEKPILFSGPMVRALLEGRKTMTRRVLKVPPDWKLDPAREAAAREGNYWFTPDPEERPGFLRIVPRLVVGDLLWVREAMKFDTDDFCCWAADMQRIPEVPAGYKFTRSSMPSMFMPRWASRITLEVTAVKVERLQDINRGDAMEEGCPFPNMAKGDDPRQWFSTLWESINGEESWQANPWVAAFSFKVHVGATP